MCLLEYEFMNFLALKAKIKLKKTLWHIFSQQSIVEAKYFSNSKILCN